MFSSLSVASLMNRAFINIKVDREELPHVDDLYMVARQLMMHEGGWPNNLFLTPDLKPFYAGGAFSTQELHGIPAFPRLLEWIQSQWATNESEIRAKANDNAEVIVPFLVHEAPQAGATIDVMQGSSELLNVLRSHYDARFGGFFEAPKFPRENYLQFLLDYYDQTASADALEMVTMTLRQMATGAIYDHVSGGFHRYAVDKPWYAPRFEKMLTTQALLARAYVDAAYITQSPYLTDIGLTALDFVSGPMTDANGAFYAAIDAKSEGREGQYYLWDSHELQDVLTEDETDFFVTFYALADIPAFPGHIAPLGQSIVARKPLDMAARDNGIPYLQVSAMSAHVFNKLLAVRNKRSAPLLDNKVIVGWNGLMIDAFAHAGRLLNRPAYIQRARKAANYLLEHAIDNDGKLKRIIVQDRAMHNGTLEDYAYFIRGLISLQRAEPKDDILEAIKTLCAGVEELFGSDKEPGYFFTQDADNLWLRIKSDEDTSLPNANAVMIDNFAELYALTKDQAYLDKASAMVQFFLAGKPMLPEIASMLAAAIKVETIKKDARKPQPPLSLAALMETSHVKLTASLTPPAEGSNEAELTLELDIAPGWHINMGSAGNTEMVGYKIELDTPGVELGEVSGPRPMQRVEKGEFLRVYEGQVTLTAKIKLQKSDKPLKVNGKIRYQPCLGTVPYPGRQESFSV